MSDSCPPSPFPAQSGQQSLMQYLHHLSGQLKEPCLLDFDHTYAKAWNKHPDPAIKSRPAKFLFMKDFPRQPPRQRVDDQTVVDIENVDEDKTAKLFPSNPFLPEIQQLLPRTPTTPQLIPGLPTDEAQLYQDKMPVDKTNWSPNQSRLWTKVLKILQSDRLARLCSEGRPNEIIIRRNLLEKSAARFRQAFASIVQWEVNHLSWLHSMLHTHITPIYLSTYHEAMQLLRAKVSLVDRFYTPLKGETDSFRHKQIQQDPIQAVLNNYRPKRINGSPLFLIVPNGPQILHHLTSARMKYWHGLFGSLGKVITVSVHSVGQVSARDFMFEIRMAVRDKIKECKATFHEGRPLVLVGFGASSLIASHCALENQSSVTATICLGYPIIGVNGCRGDLDDPLLESTVPTLFVIGSMSSMCSLDDLEDFRERITKCETGLVVVGGCNDRLILSDVKKRTDGITQGIVDRCIADEIYDFVSCIINPNHVTDFNASVQTPVRSPSTGAKSPGAKLNKTSPLATVPMTPPSAAAAKAEARRRKNSRSKSESKYSEDEIGEEPAIPEELPEKSPTKESDKKNRRRDRSSSRSKSRPKRLKISIDPEVLDDTTQTATPSGRSSANPSPIPKRQRLSSSGEITSATASGRNSISSSPTPRTPTPRTPKGTPATSRATTPAPPISEDGESGPSSDSTKTEPATPSESHSRPPTPPSASAVDSPGTPAVDRMAQMTYSTITTTVSSASTRRGRTIRAPKQLDI